MIRRHVLRGGLQTRKRLSFSTSIPRSDYEDTISNLKIGEHTRVIFQGFTGTHSIAYSTNYFDAIFRKTGTSGIEL